LALMRQTNRFGGRSDFCARRPTLAPSDSDFGNPLGQILFPSRGAARVNRRWWHREQFGFSGFPTGQRNGSRALIPSAQRLSLLFDRSSPREPCRVPTVVSSQLQQEIPMDWNRVEGNWKQMTGKIKEQWGKLTDDDLAQINGNREQLEGKIQERYGKAKDEVRQDIDDWFGRQRW